ncbi:MAG: hypothetical protein Q8Q32_03420 [bacterium]|nr:hypothetical protein [bacterium]
MALPQANQNPNIGTDNPYEHLARNRSSSPGWSWRLFSFSIVIFIIVAVIYMGIKLGYKPFLNSRIDNLDSQLEEFESKISMQDQQSFINFYSQAVYLEEILDKHIFFSPFFDLLERHTHSGVYFSNVDYEFSENKISLTGRADSFEALGQQLARLDALVEVNRVILSESQSIGGGINFQMLLFPDSDLFSIQQVNSGPSAVSSPPSSEPDIESETNEASVTTSTEPTTNL